MATGKEVLSMLLPNGGWVITADDYESIKFLECEPITKKQFEAGFSKYDAWKTAQDVDRATAKTTAQAKLEALGLTVEDLQALGL